MSTVTEAKRWAHLKEAATYSGLTQQCLRNYGRDGMLALRRPRRKGATKGATLVDLRELDRLIEGAAGLPAVLAVNAPRKKPA